jgi:hypothetical protein
MPFLLPAISVSPPQMLVKVAMLACIKIDLVVDSFVADTWFSYEGAGRFG